MKEIKTEEVKEVEVTTEENTETEVSTEEVKESKLKAFGTKVKSGLQKHGKNIAKGAVIGLGLVAAYAIGSRAGGNDDDRMWYLIPIMWKSTKLNLLMKHQKIKIYIL